MSNTNTQPDTTPGHSTKFYYGTLPTQNASTSWFEIGQITEISPPELEADDVEVSNMQSPEQFKQFDPGWADAGEVELTVQYTKAQATTLYGIFRQPKLFKIQFEDGSVWEYQGYVKKLGGEIDREGVITQTVTTKISGKPTFTAASA